MKNRIASQRVIRGGIKNSINREDMPKRGRGGGLKIKGNGKSLKGRIIKRFNISKNIIRFSSYSIITTS